jgi:hypothetical protein
MVRERYVRRGFPLLVRERVCGEVNPPFCENQLIAARSRHEAASEPVPPPAKYSPKIIGFCRNLSMGKQSLIGVSARLIER